ncbi:MAG: hypothetical protein J7501_00405 [Bdellovibrio sp.]|nr:hypothetical protein [Bdellovibrio sp.]
MPFQPRAKALKRHPVFILDSRRLMLGFTALLMTLSSSAHAHQSCEAIFEDAAPYKDEAMALALEKATHLSDPDGLSIKDLEFLVEKIYDQNDGKMFRVSDYWKKSAKERTRATILRQVGEAVTTRGLITYFRENGLLLESSTLSSKLKIINRSAWFNAASGVWMATGISRGKAPVFIPEFYFKITPDEMTTLILRGFHSKEGREILDRHGLKQEVLRGYTLFNRYYTRIALAVVAWVLYEKTADFLSKEDNHTMEEFGKMIWEEIILRKAKGQ